MKNSSLIFRFCDHLGLLNDNVSLRRRISRFLLLLLLCPVVVITTLYMVMAGRILDQEMSQLMLRSLTQTAHNVETQLTNVAEITQGVLLASYPYINSSDSLKQQMDDVRAMSNIIEGYENRGIISKMRLYVHDSKIYTHQRDRFYPMSDISDTDITTFHKSFNEGRNVLWLETYPRKDIITKESTSIISCVSLLRSLEDYNQIACVLYADIPVAALTEMMMVGFEKNESICVINSEGVILAHSNPDLISVPTFGMEQVRLITSAEDGTFWRKGESGRELIAYTHLSYPNWILVTCTPRSVAYQESQSSFYVGGILLFVLMLALMLFASFILFFSVLEVTIQRIGKTLKRLSTGSMDILSVPPPASEDEGLLSALENNTNQLISSVRTLIEEAYRDKLEQREAQLRALQAQINPHFLYNTLDMIKWMIMSSDRDTGVYIINSLSRYFRKSLNMGQDIVPLRDEIELVRSYLDIQRKRFSDGFSVRWSVDESVLDCRIPKITLQPFVENALLHGLYNQMNGAGVIGISVLRQLEDILVEITDNGVGMDAKTQINAMAGNGSHGFGISNVNERIRLFCGPEYGVSIFSEPGVGTRVILRLRSVSLQKE